MMADRFYVVSLGDSIATGTLTPFEGTYSYVFYLQKMLREMGRRPVVHPLAHDGDTSRDLLWKLKRLHRFRSAVKGADLITVSIGGNDLLRAASIPGFTSINTRIARHGAREFTRNWPQIVDEIRDINPDAELVVLNIYNPYNESGYLGGSYAHDRNLCELTDGFLAEMNGAIAAYAPHNYRIADVYAAFKRFSRGNMHRACCLYPDSLLRNPHPTPGAQRLIAGLVARELDLQAGGQEPAS